MIKSLEREVKLLEEMKEKYRKKYVEENEKNIVLSSQINIYRE